MDRLDELQIFLAILDAASLSGAARKLRRSGPAVTRALHALEQRVGLRLIERTTRRLAPTEAGIRLAAQARQLLADYEQTVREEDAGPLRGTLRITAPYIFGRRHLTPAVIAFLNQHPALHIEMVFHDRNLDLIEHGLDLAVRIGALPDASLVARRVGEVRRVLVASPDYLARRGTPATPHALAEHDVIFSAGIAPVTAWRFRDQGRELVVRLAPRLMINEIEAILTAVTAGHGIGRALSYQVADQLAAGTLVRLLGAYEPDPLPVQLVLQGTRHMAPRLRACVDFLATELGALAVLQPMPAAMA